MPTITQKLEEQGGFEHLLEALSAAGIDDMLQGGEFTLFAPTDAAFGKLPPGVLDQLKQDPERLRQILQHHIAQRAYSSEQLVQNETVDVLYGNPLPISPTDELDISIATFTETDIEADNGFIHSIDTVLQPATEFATP